jgi:hypothetical protein
LQTDQQRKYHADYMKRWRANNREKSREYRNEWYRKNKDRLRDKRIADYAKNKDKYNANRVARRRAKYSWVDERKVALGCSVCGYDNNSTALHFHHVDSQIKENSIARLVRSFASQEEIEAEISKCIVLCSNCHAELHNPS